MELAVGMVILPEELMADIEVDHTQEETTEGLTIQRTSHLQSMGRFSMKVSKLMKQVRLHQFMMVLSLQVHQRREGEEFFLDQPEIYIGDNLIAISSLLVIISDKAILQ
jgi:hypothetical protein